MRTVDNRTEYQSKYAKTNWIKDRRHIKVNERGTTNSNANSVRNRRVNR